MKPTATRPRLLVSADGKGIVNHAGTRLLCDLADRLGLTGELSRVMAATTERRRVHDRGRLLVDVAVMLADGGTCVSDLAVLRDQPALFGEVASTPTAWRVLSRITPAMREGINRARAAARRVAWEAGADPGFYVLDIDGTLLNSHSEKKGAAPTYKHGFGFHPLLCYLDETGEALAGILRPGNAGSNTAADHIIILDEALFQLPVWEGDHPREGTEIVVRADSAGLTHGFVNAIRQRGLRFSIGLDLTAEVAKTLVSVPESDWTPAVTSDGAEERDGAQVTEVTHLLDLSAWPEGTRAIARREDPHPGAQLTFTDLSGHRFQVFVTDQTNPDITFLEARQRGRARAELSLRDAKDLGLANLPFNDFEANAAWLLIVLISQDLLAWTGRLVLPEGFHKAWPKRLRYTLWHQAGVLARSGRRTRLHLQATWPWAPQLAGAFHRLHTLPLTA